MATQTGSYDFKAAKQAKLSAEATAAADATTKANDAKKVATNFIATDSSGMMVYDGTSGTHTPSNPGSTTRNVLIDSDSVDIRQGTDILATFGSPTRIGKDGAENVTITSNGVSINTPILSTAVNMTAEVVDEETRGIITFGDIYDPNNENAPMISGYCDQEFANMVISGKSLDGQADGGIDIQATGPDIGDGATYSNLHVSGLGEIALFASQGNADSTFQITPYDWYIKAGNIGLDETSFAVKSGRDLRVQNRITQGAHPESTDFDDYIKTGLYLCAGMTGHRPAAVSSWMLICIFNNSGSVGAQLAVSTGTSYLYKRTYASSTWSAWTRVQFATYTNP